MRAVLVALLCGPVLSAPVNAQFLFCTAPRPPFCVESFAPFDDRFERDACRMELENHRARMRQYVQCLADEQEEAVRQVNRAVEAFNARLRR